MESTPHILVVDDDQEIRKLLGRYLQGQGFRVTLVKDGRHAEEALACNRIDLVVLDLMLPDISGLELCRTLRGRSDVPVILLTALKEDVDRIIGLEVGADDYLGKPFNPRELLARIRAVLRRTSGREAPAAAPAQQTLHFAGFTAYPATRRVLDASGAEVPLTGAEFELLLAFLQRPGRLLTRDQLLDITQGREANAFDRAIDNQISRLRKKIEADARNPTLIKTVWGGGYTLSAEVRKL